MTFISLNFSLFFNWWAAGLKTLCPNFLRSMLILDHNKVIIGIDNGHVKLKHYLPTNTETSDSINFKVGDDLEKDAALSWLRTKQQKPTKLIVVIPDDFILTKTIQFPAAANNNLKEALGFEINRKTPFSVDQVYYDFSIISHDKKTDKLKIDLVIVPKAQIDSRLEIVDNLGIKIDALIPENQSDKYASINLLPINKQTPESRKYSFNSFLTAVTAIIFLATLYIPVNKQNQYIDELEKELHSARKSAIELNKLNEEKQSLLRQINFLTDKQSQTVSSLSILSEVTHIIPDDTWLNRFSISKNQLQIQGESSNASVLIQTLETSDSFEDVQFKSPVTRNNRTGKDKFNLSAKLAGDS